MDAFYPYLKSAGEWCRRHGWRPLLLVLAAGACARQPQEPTVGERLRELTGAHTRLVWVQDQGDGTDTGLESDNLRLMGFDSDDGLGERPLLADPANYGRPLITPLGDRVIFTNRRERRVYIVHWDGSGLRPLLENRLALCVWSDAQGREWVLVGEEDGMNRLVASVERRLIDNPNVVEPVWDRTRVGMNNFQMSADGRYAGGVFPWPDCGVADLASGSLRVYGKGCYPSLAPDNSGLFWIFDGAHRNLLFFRAGTDERWRVSINDAPGIDGYEVYYPRWSNHARFLVMTGPFKVGTGDNRIRGGGTEVDVYVGRFDQDFQAVEAWRRVSDNHLGDFYPDLWVAAPPPAASRIEPVAPTQVELPSWPALRQDLLLAWENRAGANEITLADGASAACRLEPRGLARFGRYFEMQPARGWFEADADSVRRVATAWRSDLNSSMEMTLTPADDGARAPAVILALGTDRDDWRLLLGERTGRLALLVRLADGTPGPEIDLGPLPAGRPSHVVVSFAGGLVRSMLDGVETASRPLPGLLAQAGPDELLTFGAAPDGAWPWTGAMEGVAVYDRALTEDEARAAFNAYRPRLAARRPLPAIVVDVRLLQPAEIPPPEDILPYRRALALEPYAVERIVAGADLPGKIMVARWVIMDGEILPEAARSAGGQYRLRLQAFDERPELEGERQVMSGDAWELPLYFSLDD